MAKAVKKKSAKEASGIFHNIMAASVSNNDWHEIHDNYKDNPAALPSEGDRIEIKNKVTKISELATFLPFDGVHFTVETRNTKKLVFNSDNIWRLAK